MSPTLDAFFRSWPFDPWLVSALGLSASVYLRGWLSLHRRDARRWRVGRLAAFLGGLATIFLALASPIEPFASLLLQVHMIQHLILMFVAPPLLWLGAPLFPMLTGLPKPIRDYWIAPLFRARWLRSLFGWLTHPLVAWPLFTGATWLWHTPRGYELGLSRSEWHLVEHACFVATALLFWYPVVRPYPSRPRWSRWLLFPYLILADVQNTMLAAWLTFSGTVLYPHYSQVPRLAGLSALEDQAAAGVIMWVPGSIVLLLPLVWIGMGLLEAGPRLAARDRRREFPQLRIISSARPTTARPRFDILQLPILGSFLCWPHARLVMQIFLAVLAAAVIFDGLFGPQLSPMNLAGVLPWIHWRGALILGLLVAGNVFCMACPFTLPRTLARRWLPLGRPWPRRLRGKWLAAGLLALFLGSYEVFSLWDSPWLTAWIAVGYFVAAFVVDSFFSGQAFCKYVCPIGQFNFVNSLVSPLEVTVREPAVCATCSTKECIRGAPAALAMPVVPGCQLGLFQPRKLGNLDCTFCLDCVRACPHDNVGVLAVVPGNTLRSDTFRSGIGRFSRRTDLAALALVLVFGAFANAAGMVGPVVMWQDQLRDWLGNPPQWFVTSGYYLLAIGVLPLLLVSCAAALGCSWRELRQNWLPAATRFSFALIPIGFGMWLAHYSFHLFTSYETLVPVTQRFVAGFGWSGLGEPHWQCACCRAAGAWITQTQILMLDFGLLLSLYTGFRMAEDQTRRTSQAIRTFLPWAGVMVLLFAVGVWIVFQPMQMRGTLPALGSQIAKLPSADRMRQFARSLMVSWLVLGAPYVPARGDGGIVRVVDQQAGTQISVFTSPNPLRAGPVDVSVLVQDLVTGQPVPDVNVRVILTPRDRSRRSLQAMATADAATNKLLRAAVFDVPDVGWWDVEVVSVAERGRAHVHFAMETGQPLPQWLTVWPWFVWPAGTVLLFGAHRLLVWRKTHFPAPRAPQG